MESVLLVYGRKSPLLGSFGCLERRNITVIMESITSNVHFPTPNFDGDILLKSLDDPCQTIFLYNFHSRKFFKWQSSGFVYNQKRSSDLPPYLELLCDLRHSFTNHNTTKQILLFEHTPSMDPNIARALEKMDRETQWNIIIQCTFNCPVLSQFPLHRIITAFDTFDISRHVRDLVRNPNFNKMKWLKQIKMDSDKVTELQNRNIHIVDLFVSLSVMQQVAFISYNTRNTNTKIILHHYSWWNKEFWDSFMSRSGLNSSNIEHVFKGYVYVSFPERDVSVLHFVISNMQCHFNGNALFFVGPPKKPWRYFPETIYKEQFEKCLETGGKYDTFKYYDSNHNFVQSFVEDLVKKRFPDPEERIPVKSFPEKPEHKEF